MTALLKIENIHKSFGGLKALDGISLEVQPNTLTAIIGPNGCGKSTLFNVISGVFDPDEGEGSILFDGQEIRQMQKHEISRLGISRTYQDTRLFPELTVMENLLLPPKKQIGEKITNLFYLGKKIKQQEEELKVKALEMLDLLDIRHMAYEYTKNLSGGQRKLVDIGRVLMSDPRMVLLDEPMAGVNPALSEKLFLKIVDLREKLGLTVLLIEHDMDMIMRDEVDYVYVSNFGKIIAYGTPDEVKRNQEVIEAYLGR